MTLHAGCRTQTIVAQSSGEAEFVAATAAASYGKYYQALCSECLKKSVRPTLRVDSTSAIGTASRRGQRLRHPDTRFLWLQDEVVEKRVLLEKVPGTLNGADSNTKAGDAKALEFGREVMGMVKLNKAVLTLLSGATGAQGARQEVALRTQCEATTYDGDVGWHRRICGLVVALMVLSFALDAWRSFRRETRGVRGLSRDIGTQNEPGGASSCTWTTPMDTGCLSTQTGSRWLIAVRFQGHRQSHHGRRTCASTARTAGGPARGSRGTSASQSSSEGDFGRRL